MRSTICTSVAADRAGGARVSSAGFAAALSSTLSLSPSCVSRSCSGFFSSWTKYAWPPVPVSSPVFSFAFFFAPVLVDHSEYPSAPSSLPKNWSVLSAEPAVMQLRCGRSGENSMLVASSGNGKSFCMTIGVYWTAVAPPCAGATVMETFSA